MCRTNVLVRILSARTFKAHSCLYPIASFQEQLRELGLDVRVQFSPNDRLFEADVVCLDSEAFNKRRANRSPPDRDSFVPWARERASTLVWLDTAAHTGGTAFQLLPYLDLYGKNQLFNDRTLHTRSWYADRIFAQYYRDKYSVHESGSIPTRVPAAASDLGKLAVTWNLGLGDYTSFDAYRRRWRVLTRRSGYRTPSHSALEERHLDIAFRVATQYGLDTVTYHRTEASRLIREFALQGGYSISPAGRVGYQRYVAETRQAKIAPSPFGSGEVCYRDFECFLAGAALVKPDMGHIDTWPNFYEDGVTYKSHRWDFADLNEVLAGLLESPKSTQQLAAAGQERFVEARTAAGGRRFAEHFRQLMRRAQHASSTET